MSEPLIVSVASLAAVPGAVAFAVASAGGHLTGCVEHAGAACGETHSKNAGPN